MPVFLLFFTLQLCALAAAPLLAWAVPFGERGYGLARAVGWLAVGLVCAVLSLLGIPSTGWTAWLVLALALAPLTHPRVRKQLREIPRREILTVEALFHGVTVLFLFFRACQPEIYWGEKPMDFTFLNYFVRLEHLPPEDPWAAGHRMRYYYLGTYLVALLHKMTGLDTAVGYNVAIALLAGLFACSGYAALRQVLGPRRAVLGALGLLLLADWESFRLALGQNAIHGFDLFWASSRIMKVAIANEYPQWSFLFADLHAHVIALPFSLGALAIAVSLFTRTRSSNPGGALLYGMLWGSLIAINTWDFLSLAVVTAVLLPFIPERKKRLQAMALAGTLAALPFLSTIANGGREGIRLERIRFFTAGEMLRYLGLFLIPALGLIGWRLRRSGARVLAIGGATALLVLVISGLLLLKGMKDFPWDVSLLAAIVIGVGVAAGLLRVRRLRVFGFLLAAAGLLLWLGEYFFVRDRLNSVFKISFPLWLLTGLALAVLLPYARLRFARWTIGLAVGAAAIGAVVNATIMTEVQQVQGPRGTLDGLAYLDAVNPEERLLVAFLQREVRGVPRVAEAQGSAYGPYARIAMHTGLPTWLGWEHHVEQRGLASDIARQRQQQLSLLYGGTDELAAYNFLRDAGISLVIVGSLERETYGSRGLEKFRDTARYRELARFGDEAVYQVLDFTPPPRVSGRRYRTEIWDAAFGN